LPALLLAGAFVCTTVGCSDSGPPRAATYPVSTSITYQGKPIPGAFVALHPKEPLADVPTPRANIGKEGDLKVTTYDTADGAPAGEYVLTIEWYKPIKQGADVVAGPNVIPRKYASPKTSPVVIKVAEGTTEIPPIKLK
jgi:hypothetical protein